MLEYGFDTSGAAFGKQEVDAGEQLIVQLAGFVELVDEGEVHEVGHVFGEAVGGYGDDAFHAYGHLCYHEVVVAGEHSEVVGLVLEELQALGYVATGFLDAYDIGAIGSQAQRGGWQEVAAGTAGYVVEYDGLVGGGSDGLEVLVHAFLRGLVVVGGHAENSVYAMQVSLLKLAHYLVGVVAANAADYGHFAGAVVNNSRQQFLLFGSGQGRGLGSSAHSHQEVYSSSDDMLHQFLECGKVDFPVLMEWGSKGNSCAV